MPEQPSGTNQPADWLEPGNIIGERVARLIRLFQILQSGRPASADRIADRLQVSRRTLFRDIGTLRKAGFPIERRPEGGYLLRVTDPPAAQGLDVGEVLGLMLLGKTAQTTADRPMLQRALDAIGKILGQLSTPTRDVYEDLMRQVSVAPGATSESREDERYYRLVQYGIEERFICRATYDVDGTGESRQLLIHPLHLHFWTRSWYVMAFCEQFGEIRPFKLSRFKALELTDRRYTSEPFRIDEYLDDAWGVIPEGVKYDVVVEFSPRVARNVADVRWHRTQETIFHDDGSCTMRFCVNGLSEIKWWILGYGDLAIVREPEPLREEICAIARSMAQRYADT
jgi:predicted DNA-binding transcriptional regulator YafY